MRRKPGNWRACTDAETCEANVPTLGGNYQGGEGPLEQRRTSGGNGGVDAAHLPLGMSARGGANSPRVVYASGAENLGPPKANGHYHPSQAFLRWSSAAPAVPRRPCYRRRILLEQQRREFMQATAPRQKLVSGAGGFVEERVDPGVLQFFHSGLARSAVFQLSIAEEHRLDLLFEGGRILDLRERNVAAAEQADVGKLVQVSHGRGMGLHTAHRQPSHGAVRGAR